MDYESAKRQKRDLDDPSSQRSRFSSRFDQVSVTPFHKQSTKDYIFIEVTEPKDKSKFLRQLKLTMSKCRRISQC